MSLTTQVPKDVDLASRVKRSSSQIGNVEVRWVKSYVDITNKNYTLLEILDALKDFKTIPDLDKKTAVRRMTAIITELKDNKKIYLVKYALNYPPRARALLGAILESIGKKEDLIQLKQSLNPLTTFNIAMTQEILPNSKKWFIK